MENRKPLGEVIEFPHDRVQRSEKAPSEWDIHGITEALCADRVDRIDRRTGEAFEHLFILWNACTRRTDGQPAVVRLAIDKRNRRATYNDGENPSIVIPDISQISVNEESVYLAGEDDRYYRQLEIRQDGSYTPSAVPKSEAQDRMRWQPLSDEERQAIIDGVMRYF